MKSLSQCIMEAFGVKIPSYTVNAMMDMLKCKSEDEVRSFFKDEGLEDDAIEGLNVGNIFRSIQTINKECDYLTVDADTDLIDKYSSGEISRGAVEAELDIVKATCWVIYMTDGDSSMLILRGKRSSAEKSLKEFVKNCDHDVILAYSWK